MLSSKAFLDAFFIKNKKKREVFLVYSLTFKIILKNG